jgi:serine/threonine-protein kinase
LDKHFWKTDWFIGLAVTLFFLIAAGGKTLQGMERGFYDFTVALTAHRPATEKVTLVAIDEDSVMRLGPWPWSRDILAQGLAVIERQQPKVVGFALDLQPTQVATGLEPLRKLRDLYVQSPRGEVSYEFIHQFETLTNQLELALNGDHALARQIESAKNVVLGIPYRVRAGLPAVDMRPLPKYMDAFALPIARDGNAGIVGKISGVVNRPDVPVATSFKPPAEVLGSVAHAAGHYQPHIDSDGHVRFERLIVEYQGKFFPSLSIVLAAAGMDLKLSDISVKPGIGVQVGNIWLDTDKSQRLMPYYYKRRNDKSAFNVVSFNDVYTDKLAPGVLRDRIVVVGLTHQDLVEPVLIPTGDAVPPLYVLGNTIASILNGNYYQVPDWAPWVEILAIMLVALYLVSLLPRIRLGTGLALTAILVISLLSGYIIAMTALGIWLMLVTPIMQLVVGHAILGAKRGYLEIITRSRAENAEANRMLALAFQSQGQLDMAFEKFRKCPIDDGMLELLYALGQDYERKRQFSRASVVFRYITSYSPEFRDAAKRILSNSVAAGSAAQPKAGSASTGSTLVLKIDGLQKPMLGRYEIEKELGRGAMGMVYLGRDPKIGRTVAIKTMALSQEFDESQLAEVKERFFREASTAGRLNHPNIVTIYDVGEEHDLAYIAMDFLEGVNLTQFTEPGHLLPLNEVFHIIGKVAEALDYAHANQVVHRDIKPANVVYNEQKRQVTVTDFGVAFLVDANKTKTGTILGTPSYMSPEQLAGGKVDGRSDMFSLGVMLFQMVTGELPFIGDSIATLLYKIANEKHPDPRMFRPDLPHCVGRVIDKALRKEMEERFQNGKQLVTALKKCQQIIEKSKAQEVA